MKKTNSTFYNIAGFLTSSAINIILGLAVAILVVSYTYKGFTLGAALMDDGSQTSESHVIEIVIPEGADSLGIASILEENGLVSNKYFFYIQSHLNGSYKGFLSGTFLLNTNMKTGEIMEALQNVNSKIADSNVKITIPEGYNIKQIAALLESKGFFSAQEFLDACGSTEYNYDFLNSIKQNDNYLEGYLFPDTYFLSENPTPDELITKMLNRFDDVFNYELRERCAELGLSFHDAVKMASIIESEVSVASERELTSAIIHNRLKKGIKLEMCSTIMYALDKRKDRLFESDLQIDSPYNTYLYPGLPSGPIANPGKASLEAALYPADVPYLYMVLKSDGNGEHFFTDDFNQFLQAKAQYNQKF